MKGFDELQEQIGILGVRQNTIDQTETRHSNFLLILANQIVNVEDVDAADAMTQLTLLETNLQTSFQLIAGTRDLSLVNYHLSLRLDRGGTASEYTCVCTRTGP